MKIYVAGVSHLTHYTKVGAAYRGLDVTNNPKEADLIIVAQDMPTLPTGERMPQGVMQYVYDYVGDERPVILMSQVPPGFCRKLNMPNLYHYPETLRIKDSYHRACNPEYIVIGCAEELDVPREAVWSYVRAFECPVRICSYETAEMCKIAVNTMLAAQVDYANRMSAICQKVGADWSIVSNIIGFDSRIGHKAYLTPGRWQDSLHLLRDSITLKEIEDV